MINFIKDPLFWEYFLESLAEAAIICAIIVGIYMLMASQRAGAHGRTAKEHLEEAKIEAKKLYNVDFFAKYAVYRQYYLKGKEPVESKDPCEAQFSQSKGGGKIV